MTTYYLHTRNFRLPFPFADRAAAECHRAALGAVDEYAVEAVSEPDCAYSQREDDDTYYEITECQQWNNEQDMRREEMRG